jgi:putative transposase
MYLESVSTRRVQDVTEKLCGYEVSSTQVLRVTQELDVHFEQFRSRRLGDICYLIIDVLYLKVRHNGIQLFCWHTELTIKGIERF